MIDPYDAKNRRRLFDAIEHHYKQLDWMRTSRVKRIRDYAGTHYSQNDERRPAMANLLLQTADAYRMILAGNRPRVQVETRHRQLVPFSRTLEAAVNNLIAEIRLEFTLQELVLDAFFGPAVVKVFRGDSVPVEVENDVWMDPGAPFAGRCSPDDTVWDTSALNWRTTQFICDRYRFPYKQLLRERRFNKSAVKMLKPSPINERIGKERASAIAAGQAVDPGQVIPEVELVDVWIPSIRSIATWGVEPDYTFIDTPPLQMQRWTGGETGPYRMLNFGPVPDNTIPTSPADNLSPLVELANSLILKGANQARNARTVNLYQGDMAKEADRVRRANDNDWLASSNPKGIQQLKVGGVDQAMVAFSLGVLQLFDRMSGNVPGRLGLDSQADTLGQEQIMQGRLSRSEAATMYRVNRFTESVVRDLAQLLWFDANKRIPHERELQVGDLTFHVNDDWEPYRPDSWHERGWIEKPTRMGKFLRYNFSIVPQSMSYKSPQAQAGMLLQLVQQLLPLVQAGQLELDANQLVSELATLQDQPRLERIFRTPENPQQTPQTEPRMPAATTRNYVRRNVPTGGTQQSRTATLMQTLYGGNSQSNGQQLANAGG